PFGVDLKNISFSARSGEIFGIAGVAGAGQSELFEALAGERASPAGAIRLNGRPIGEAGPSARRKLGLCAAPEERNGHAAALDMTLSENALLTGRERLGLTARGFLRKRAMRDFAAAIIDRFGVRAAGPDAAARSLSGGNLQKFIIGREILQRPDALV